MDDPQLKRHNLDFLQTVDTPTPEELKIYYEDRYYQTEQGNYSKGYSKEECVFLNLKIAQKASIITSLREGRTSGSLLDVGCGEGFSLAWFQEHGWFVEGIEYSTAGIEGMNPELLSQVEIGDLFALLNKRINAVRRYDVVLLNNVLEHVSDPVGLLTSLRQLVNPKGVLVITVPNDGSSYQEDLLKHGDISDRFWIAIPDHLAYFTYESLMSTVAATGWECRDIIADFPIDIFLLHPGSNYVRDSRNGPDAHRARIRMETMLGNYSHHKVNEFYRALAQVGLGRNLTAFLLPNKG